MVLALTIKNNKIYTSNRLTIFYSSKIKNENNVGYPYFIEGKPEVQGGE